MTRVLIVDDKPENLYLLRALLQGHDCTVDEARHGAEALAKARQAPPELIISDLLMPVMDGYTLLRQWKADERLRQIPFVVYTATYTDPKDERLALDLGADAFIIKPAEPEPFMARVREVLELKRHGALSPPQAPAGDEETLLKEYSEALVRKLEKKAQQLEQTNQALREDMARRQQVEAELAERQRFLQQVLDAEPGTVYIYDLAARCNVFTNRHWLNAHGYSAEETGAMGEALLERIFHPDDLARISAHHDAWRQAESGGIREIEYRIRDKGGRWHWLHSRETAFAHDDAGRVNQILGIAHDITERREAETALQESQRTLVTLISNLPGVVYRCRNDKDWTTEFASDGALTLFGYPASDFVAGKVQVGQLIHPDDREPVWNTIQDALKEKRSYQTTYRIRTASGQEKWVWEQGQGIYASSDELLYLEGFVIDITERKQAEATLREREEVLRLFVEHSPAAIGMFDNEMCYVAVSRRWLTDYGLSDRDIVGRSHYEIFPEIPQRWRDIHRRCLAGATERSDEDSFVRADGRADWLRWEVLPWRKADGAIGGIIIFSELITARKLAEQKLRETTRQLETLSRRLLAAQEDERRNVARELHDEIGQLLTVVKLDLQTVLRQPGTAALAPALKDGMDSIDRVVARVRDLSLDLRPSMLDDLGLAPALRWLVQRQTQRLGAGVDVKLSLPPSPPRLPSEIETACYRIAQEALTNATRHARASRMEVTLDVSGREIVLAVRDNGAGFNVVTVRRTASAAGFGLLGMQERAELAGGEFHITSAPGQGTTVEARFPRVASGEKAP